MRAQIAEGISVDFYNLHADAGTSASDEQARRSNLLQLATYINLHSAGKAVIVTGDTNAYYSAPGDKIRLFVEKCGLIDVWVEKLFGNVPPDAAVRCQGYDGKTCESSDKVFYRSGRDDGVRLWASGFGYTGDRFLGEDGEGLSEHFPVAVKFGWDRLR